MVNPSLAARQARQMDALRLFRRLFVGISGWRLHKLMDLAVSYWERPDRYK